MSVVNYMDIVDQINSHNCLFLIKIQHDENLSIIVQEGVVSGEVENLRITEDRFIEDVKKLSTGDTSIIYQIKFDGNVVAYSTRNESYADWDDDEEFTGSNYRIYTKSRFLEYVDVSTWATDDYPGKLTHYEILTVDYIIDVITTDLPLIEIVDEST